MNGFYRGLVAGAVIFVGVVLFVWALSELFNFIISTIGPW